jgi:hypothetical protein
MAMFTKNDNLGIKSDIPLAGTPKAGQSLGFQKADADNLNMAFEVAKNFAKDGGVDESNPEQYYSAVSGITKSLTGMGAPAGLPKDATGLQLSGADQTKQPFEFMKTDSINPSVGGGSLGNTNPTTQVANPQNQQANIVVESKVKETQDSSAFIGTVPENASAWKTGKTGDEINSEAKKRLDLMRSKGFGTSF